MPLGRLALASLFVCLLAATVRASPPSIHVAAGDLIGEWAARHVPDRTVAALLTVAGSIASHGALDALHSEYVPDWTGWRTQPGRFGGDLPYLLIEAGLLWMLAQDIAAEPDPGVRWHRALGAIAGILPDLIEMPHSLADPGSWRRGEHLIPWHRASAYRLPQPLHVTIAMSAAAVAVRLSITW